MDCPSCGKTVAETAWICGFCDHILDPSVLGDVYDDDDDERGRAPSAREERTSLIAWNPKPDPEEVPDAMILGDPDESDSQLMRGAAARSQDGRTATFLFYTSGATSRIVHPDSIPRITGGDQTIPRTPYEDFILSQIDGVRSVRDIHRASGLAPQEVVVTLLTLLDKGAIRIDGVAAEKQPIRLREIDDELEKTQAIERPKPRRESFEKMIAEVNAQIARREATPRHDSLSDVWAESEPDSSEDADDLIEAEQEELPTQLGDEEVTNTVRAASSKPSGRKRSSRNKRSDTKPPKPKVEPSSDPLELPTREDPPRKKTPAPLPLDPAFLVEVPPSSVKRAPSIDWGGGYDEDPVVAPVGERRESTGKKRQQREQQRKVLEKAVKRAVIQERVKTGSRKAPEPPAPAPATPPPAIQQNESARKARKLEPVDSVNMLKAQKLFDQALKDKAEGNLVSARMNMKLAMTFDPTNELYARSFEELSKNPDAQVRSIGPSGKSRARELYDQATEAENAGNVDRAIELLEQAISISKQAPFLNRLGVILAMKKREFARAQQLVEQAIDLAPENGAYQKNLQKILSMAATSDMRKQEEEKDAKRGLLGLLGRRK